MSRQHHRKHRNKIRSLYIWHRYIGLSVALLALLLAGTGILLNHTAEFRWDSRYVRSAWLLDWYGIEAPEAATSYAVDGQALTLFGDHLYFNTRPVEGEYRALHGAMATPDMVVAALDNGLLLLTREGERIDWLDESSGLPGAIQRLGSDAVGTPVAEVYGRFFSPDADWLRWTDREDDGDGITWHGPMPLTEAQRELLVDQYRSRILPVERVLLDLHSGRIFGRYGHWLMDAAAGLIMVLALSGFWMWFRRRR